MKKYYKCQYCGKIVTPEKAYAVMNEGGDAGHNIPYYYCSKKHLMEGRDDD